MPNGQHRIIGALSVSTLLSISMSVAVLAQTEAENDTAIREAEAVEEASDLASAGNCDASRAVEVAIDEWRNGPGQMIEAAYRTFPGYAEVSVTTDHRRWASARAIAYSRAWVTAMAAYAAFRGEEILSETVDDLFQDEDTGIDDVAYDEEKSLESFLGRIVEMGQVLAEHELKEKLVESGVDKNVIDSLTPSQRVDTFSQFHSQRILRQAIEETAGLIPIMTTEEILCDRSAVAVLAAHVPSVQIISRHVLQGERIYPDPSKAGEPLRDRARSYNDTELVAEMGVRIWRDEQGYPAIVAFGQAGLSPGRREARHRRQARIQAGSRARQHIQEFLDSTTNLDGETISMEEIRRGIEVSRDNDKTRYHEEILRETIEQSIRVEGEVKIRGVASLRSWSAAHPVMGDYEIVGEIVYWSPISEDAARALGGEPPKRGEVAADGQAEPDEEPTADKPPVRGSLRSRGVDMADF